MKLLISIKKRNKIATIDDKYQLFIYIIFGTIVSLLRYIWTGREGGL